MERQHSVTPSGVLLVRSPRGNMIHSGLLIVQAPVRSPKPGRWFVRHASETRRDWSGEGYETQAEAVAAALERAKGLI